MTHQAILQNTAKSYDANTDLLTILSKVGYVFPVVIWPEFRPGSIETTAIGMTHP